MIINIIEDFALCNMVTDTNFGQHTYDIPVSGYTRGGFFRGNQEKHMRKKVLAKTRLIKIKNQQSAKKI
jgi:hypothetical protein